MASMWDSKLVNEEENPWKEAKNRGHGVKGVSELRLKAPLKAFIQPPEERLSLTIRASPASSGEIIPIIDTSKTEAAELICKAAEKWGFFQVVNHGVPAALLGNVMQAAKRFFDQPAEEKRKLLKKNSGCRNVVYGTSFFSEAEKALEWKDYLSMHFVSEDEASAFWPAVSKDAAMKYLKSSETLIKRVLKILMNNLNANELDKTNRSRTIQFNYYPICPTPDLNVGVGRHSDISLVTVLLQDDVGGLHMRRGIDDEWVHVKPVAESLVINIGDSMEIMSNGVYKSVEHCVVANGNSDRMSIPIFINPKHSAIVRPLPEVLATGKKAQYKEVVFSDYATHFFSKPHDGKNTIEFAKI